MLPNNRTTPALLLAHAACIPLKFILMKNQLPMKRKRRLVMKKMSREVEMKSQPKITFVAASATALVLLAWIAMSPGLQADEAQARRLLKGMADYVVGQKEISFDYDSILEVVTKDQQKLALAAWDRVDSQARQGPFYPIRRVC